MKKTLIAGTSLFIASSAFAALEDCPHLKGSFQSPTLSMTTTIQESELGPGYIFSQLYKIQLKQGSHQTRTIEAYVPVDGRPAPFRCAKINPNTLGLDPNGSKALLVQNQGVHEYFIGNPDLSIIYLVLDIMTGKITSLQRLEVIEAVAPNDIVTTPPATASISHDIVMTEKEEVPAAESQAPIESLTSDDEENTSGNKQSPEKEKPGSSSSSKTRKAYKAPKRKKSELHTHIKKTKKHFVPYIPNQLPKTEIKKCEILSKMHQKKNNKKMIQGLFALEEIKEGTIIGWYEGKIYDDENQVNQLQKGKNTCTDPEAAYFMDGTSPQYFSVNGAETKTGSLAPVMYVNHSESPNAEFTTVDVDPNTLPSNHEDGYTFFNKKAIALKAIHNIPKGKQILANYGEEYAKKLVAQFGAKARNIQRMNSNEAVTEKNYGKLQEDGRKYLDQGNEIQEQFEIKLKTDGDPENLAEWSIKNFEIGLEYFFDALAFRAQNENLIKNISSSYWGIGGTYHLMTVPTDNIKDDKDYLERALLNFKLSLKYTEKAYKISPTPENLEDKENCIKKIAEVTKELEKVNTWLRKESL